MSCWACWLGRLTQNCMYLLETQPMIVLLFAGKILPPDNFKRYAHRFVPVESPPPTPPPPGQKTDMFGQRYIPRSQPKLWKLSYKLNHPEYVRLQEEVTKRRKMADERQKNKYSRLLPSPVSFDTLHVDE